MFLKKNLPFSEMENGFLISFNIITRYSTQTFLVTIEKLAVYIC